MSEPNQTTSGASPDAGQQYKKKPYDNWDEALRAEAECELLAEGYTPRYPLDDEAEFQHFEREIDRRVYEKNVGLQYSQVLCEYVQYSRDPRKRDPSDVSYPD
jgi:hypothetical protein